MQRTSSRSAAPTAWRASWLLLAVVCATALVALALLWTHVATPAPSLSARDHVHDDGLSIAGWGLLLLALATGAAWVAAGSLARWRAAERLRDARADLQGLSAMLDVWQWRTDRDHHLVRLQPPHGAPASAWVGRAAGQQLWDRFDTGDDSLRVRMNAQALLHDVAATQPGGARWLLRGMPRTDADGAFAGYLGTARPIEAEAPATARADEPSDVDAFGYTIGHDLRAPVRVVEGFTRIVKEDYGHSLDRIGNDHLDRVLGAAARMNNMIDALLALARLSAQPLQRQPVNLSQLAQYVVVDLERAQPERTVQVRIEPGLAVAGGDPTLLRVVLENLLGNAWKYGARSSAAKIRFERSSHEGREAFVVRDNGAGFDMRFADRLFGTFCRLHSANDFPGTGIGLASVRRIVRRHGGEVWGEAEVGKGANFFFTLGS